MPSLGDLFGFNAGRRVNDAADRARGYLQGAGARAEDALRGGLGQGREDLLGGFREAQGYYDNAAPNLANLLRQGYGAANDTLRQGYGSAESIYNERAANARGAYQDAANRAEDAIAGGVGNANRTLEPFYQQGLKNLQAYQTQLEGGQGAADAFRAYNEPYREAQGYADAYRDKQLAAQQNARGLIGSGRAAKAQAHEEAMRAEARVNDYRDRLERASARGEGVAGKMSDNYMAGGQQTASIRQGLGDRIGGVESRAAGDLAGLRTGLAGAVAGNQVGEGGALAGLGLNIADRSAGLASGRGQALSNLATGGGSALANLIYGQGQQLGALEINRGNAQMQAGNLPFQNLVNLVGAGARAYNNRG